jgi:ankyrin repeat protein
MVANLSDAARNNDVAQLQRILEAGAPIESRDADGMTPLLLAARFGGGDALAALLKAGADVHARDNVGMSALHLAALHNRFALVRPLVGAGLSVDCATARGSTPLMAAAAGSAAKAAEELLALGANVNAQNQEGKTALIYAESATYPWVMKPLLTKAGADARVKPAKEARRTQEALVSAAVAGDVGKVKQLLDRGAPVDGEPAFSETALLKAAAHGQAETVALLLEAGANPHARRFTGDTPLMSAVCTDSLETVRLLLEHGANVNAADKYGETALMNAAAAGELDNAKLLLEAGADANARTTGAVERDKTAADFAKQIEDRHERKAMLELLTAHVPPTAAARALATEGPRDVVETFPAAAKQPAFQQLLETLAELCGQPPKPWKQCKGAYRCGKVNLERLAKRYPPAAPKKRKDIASAASPWALVERLQAEVRAAGFQLLMAELADDPAAATWLVLPAADKYAALVACGTDGANYGHTTDAIIAWLQGMEKENPFMLTACGHDFVAGQFAGRVKNASALAERMCKFCPDLIDGAIVAAAEQVADALRKRSGFSLWWG